MTIDPAKLRLPVRPTFTIAPAAAGIKAEAASH